MSKQENITILNIPLSDVSDDVYQPRRGKNPQYNEIKDSMNMFGQRMPVIVYKKEKDGKDHYEVSICGNTRVKIAKELGWKTIKAIVSEEMGEIETLIQAIDDNKSRGNVTFSDTAQTIYYCYQYWVDDKDGETKNISRFYKNYCESLFSQSYIYLCIGIGDIFIQVTKEIPDMSKSIGEEIMKTYKNVLIPSLENFEFKEEEVLEISRKWITELKGNLKINDGKVNVNDITQSFFNTHKEKLINATIDKAGENIAKKTVVKTPSGGESNAGKEASSIINNSIEESMRQKKPIKNPSDVIKARVNEVMKKVENEEKASSEKKQDAAQPKNVNDDKKTEQQTSSASSNTPPQASQSPQSNVVEYEYSFANQSPVCGWDGDRDNATSISAIKDLTTIRWHGAIANLPLSIKDEALTERASNILSVWRGVLPGLYPSGIKSSLGKDVASNFIEHVVGRLFFNLMEDGYGGSDTPKCPLTSLMELEKKHPILSESLTAIGFPMLDKIEKDLERNSICVGLVSMLTPFQERDLAQLPIWSPCAVFSVVLSKGSVKSTKYIGIWPWPHLEKKDLNDAVHDPVNAFQGIPDKKSYGFIAGLHDPLSHENSYYCPTDDKKKTGTLMVQNNVKDAIMTLMDSNVECKFGAKINDSSDMSQDQINHMISSLVEDSKMEKEIAKIEKTIEKFGKK